MEKLPSGLRGKRTCSYPLYVLDGCDLESPLLLDAEEDNEVNAQVDGYKGKFFRARATRKNNASPERVFFFFSDAGVRRSAWMFERPLSGMR